LVLLDLYLLEILELRTALVNLGLLEVLMDLLNLELLELLY
jgi:hypothetical protein